MSQDPQNSQQPLPWGSQAPSGAAQSGAGQGSFPPPQQGYPQQPYQQPYPTQDRPTQPYAPQGYPQPPYPQAYPPAAYPTPAHALPTPPQYPGQKKSPIVGIISAGLVVLALVGSLAMAYPLGQLYGDLVTYAGTTQIDAQDIPPAMMEAIVGPTMGLLALALLGFVGWILGIVAAAGNRGRLWGVIAIVAGLAAPFLILAVMVAGMSPALQ